MQLKSIYTEVPGKSHLYTYCIGCKKLMGISMLIFQLDDENIFIELITTQLLQMLLNDGDVDVCNANKFFTGVR